MRLRTPAGSPLRLAYCTNVAPAATVAELRHGLATLWSDVREHVTPNGVLGLGLWFEDDVARELAANAGDLSLLRDDLEGHGFELATVNAFPARAFHDAIVKERVYRPAWTEAARATYTSAVAWAVAGLVPHESDVTLSTLPLGYPKLERAARRDAARRLGTVVTELARLRDETGVTIRLALEPEPGCALERTEEALAFFGEDLPQAETARPEELERHVGICLDLCHAAVEHEDAVAAYEAYCAAGVAVLKVQVSAALVVPEPGQAVQRELLAPFVEPRWLHQVGGATGRVLPDLPDALAQTGFRDEGPWRVHFHVPLHAAEIGGLPTTRDAVERFLRFAAGLADAPVLELETYTWSVVPGAAPDVAANVARELLWAREVLVDAGCRWDAAEGNA